jgi:ketosteroid isomerase-like protein
VELRSLRHASRSRRLDRAPSEAVTQQRIRAIRRFYAAWSSGDVTGMLKVVDPDVSIERPLGLPCAHTGLRGRRGIVALCERTAAHWDRFSCEVRDVTQRDKVLIAVVEVRADRAGETFAGRMLVACSFHAWRIASLRPAPPRD